MPQLHQDPLKTILIGNGPSVLFRELGSLVDSYDRVIRVNRCHIKGFEKHVGTRTDIWAVSLHYLVGKFYWPNTSPQPKTIVMCMARDLQRFSQQYPQEEFVPIEVSSELNRLTRDHYASTAMIAAWMFKPCDLIGIDHWQTGGNHYGDDLKSPCSHDPVGEKRIFDTMEYLGYVRKV